MDTDSSPSNVLARYKINRGGYNAVILISGIALGGIIGFRMIGQSNEERLVTLSLICFLFVGIAAFVIVFSSISVNAIEATTAGTVDFISRVKRDSFPRNSLVRMEGFTTRGSRGGSTFYGRFIFASEPQKETKKDVILPSRSDPALEEFVRQLETLNPQLDTSKFWAWIKE